MTARIAILIASVALATGCKREKTKKHASPASAVEIQVKEIFPALVPKNITKLTITREGHDPVVLDRTGGAWRLTSPIQDAADPRAVSFALDELRMAEWIGKPVATSKSEWPTRKITDADVVTLRIVQDGVELSALHLAKKQFARVGARHDVYKIVNISHYTFARELRMWRDRRILTFDKKAVTGLSLTEATGNRLVVEREAGALPPIHDKAEPGDAWTLTHGKGRLNEAVPDTLFRKLQGFAADDIADALKRADAGLQKPRMTITIMMQTGDQTLEIGGETADYVYVGRTGSERVWLIRKHAAAAFTVPLKSWTK